MSYDIQLDRSTHEVHIDQTTGDIQLVDGAARVGQQTKITLLLFLGEWFMDTSFGVPYFEDVLVKNPRWGTVNAVLRARIGDVPDSGRIRRLTLDFNRSTRELSVTFEEETALGLVGPHNVVLTLARRGL